jgi:hypothetical protein
MFERHACLDIFTPYPSSATLLPLSSRLMLLPMHALLRVRSRAAHSCNRSRVQDLICIPPREAIGCGTTGMPPCPQDMVNREGTLAILTKLPNNGWDMNASLGLEDSGCMLR